MGTRADAQPGRPASHPRLRRRRRDDGDGLHLQRSLDGTAAAADGDTYVTFTENFSFESAPAGSVLYLTDTASDVATASVDREAWTSSGRGCADRRDEHGGGLDGTDPSDRHRRRHGGGLVHQATQAFTLTGMAVANIRALESNASANASLRCEIARVNSDGTSPTVWASWCIAPTGTDNGELTTSEVARTCNVSGDDLAFTDGQRIRIRLYTDDMSSAAMATSHDHRLLRGHLCRRLGGYVHHAAADGDGVRQRPLHLHEGRVRERSGLDARGYGVSASSSKRRATGSPALRCRCSSRLRVCEGGMGRGRRRGLWLTSARSRSAPGTARGARRLRVSIW